MSTSADETRSPSIDEPADRVVLERYGVELVWDGDTVLTVLTGPVSTDEAGRPALGLAAARSLAASGWDLTTRAISLAGVHQAYRSYPGRFGARPDRDIACTEDLLHRSWLSPSTEPARGLPFGQPMLTFTPPTLDCPDGAWMVQLVGLSTWIARIDWRDSAGVESAVGMLDDREYWQVVAAMEQPTGWANAMAAEQRRLDAAAEAERRRVAYAAAVRAFTGKAVNTRIVARALRRLDIAEMPGVNRWREVKVRHVDLSAPGGPLRAAEQVVIEWLTDKDRAARIAVRDAVRAALAPLGCEVLLSKKGHLYIGADRALLAQHLDTLARAACADERKALLV